MQIQERSSLGDVVFRGELDDRSLLALLALVGSKRADANVFRRRTRLSPAAFDRLLGWLQRECLIDVVSTMTNVGIEDELVLTERGEALLSAMLEKTCELPEYP